MTDAEITEIAENLYKEVAEHGLCSVGPACSEMSNKIETILRSVAEKAKREGQEDEAKRYWQTY